MVVRKRNQERKEAEKYKPVGGGYRSKADRDKEMEVFPQFYYFLNYPEFRSKLSPRAIELLCFLSYLTFRLFQMYLAHVRVAKGSTPNYDQFVPRDQVNT